MKKIIVSLMALLALTITAQAQVTPDTLPPPWTLGGAGALTFNQVGLYNWAAGGQDNLTLIGNLNLFANGKWDKGSWENSLDLAYGFIKNNYRYAPENRISKAEDKMEFNSKYGHKSFSDKLFYSGLLNFRSQFTHGRDKPDDPVYISRGLSPAYLTLAVGLDFKPNDKLSLFLSPLSGKMTIVTDDSLAMEGAFGVNQIDPVTMDFRPGSFMKTRIEFGATFKAKLKTDIMENISLESNLLLFSNYIDRPQNVDLNWNNAIVAKINKYITVNLFTDMIYDHDVDVPRRDAQTGDPVYSVNPEPIFNPETQAFQSNTIYWPGPNYPEAGNPQPDDDLGDVIQIQRKGPILQFKEIFGVGFSYKF